MLITQNNDLWQQEVEFLPYIQAFPQLAEHHQYDEKQVVLSSEHEHLFGIHSSKAFLIKHYDALEIINDCVMEMFNLPPTFEVTSIKSGATIRAKIALDQFPEIDLDGDKNKIYLLFGNSYARPGDFKLNLGVYREICSNGAVVGQTVAGFNARQLRDEGFNPTSLQIKIARLIEDAKYLYDLWMSWREIHLDYDQALDIFGKKFSDSLLEQVLIPDKFPRDMWSTYNDFTAFSTHNSKLASSQINTDNAIASLFYGKNSPLRELDQEIFTNIKAKKETAIQEEAEGA